MENRCDWLKERDNGIGASEAAAIMACSPYQSADELWEIKTGKCKAEDIGEKPYVKYGTDAEEYLRLLFAMDYPEYAVSFTPFKIMRSGKHPFIFCTPDGELEEIDTGRSGGLEIKTTEIMQSSQWSKWDNRVPDNYYCQVLHQFLSTEWTFIKLKAQLRWQKDGEWQMSTRHYHFERYEVQEDSDYLLKEEIKFWGYVKSGKYPDTLLPSI